MSALSSELPPLSNALENQSTSSSRSLSDEDTRVKDVGLEVLSQKKTVSFNQRVTVVLIPTWKEYKKAGCACDMWLNCYEITRFRTLALAEISSFRKIHNISDVRLVLTKLYQPEPESISANTSINRITTELSESLIAKRETGQLPMLRSTTPQEKP